MLFFDIFFSGKILSFFVGRLSKNKRHKKYRIFGFLLSALILLSIHVVYFISKKESNFFELLNLPRVFEMQDLQIRVDSLKKQKQTSFLNNTIRLSEIKEILSNAPLKNSYDKFNKKKFDKREEMMSISQRFQMILYQKAFENSIYYVIMTAIILISSDDENSKKSRKWVVGTMVAFFFIEMNYLFLNNNEGDLIDQIFPFMSIFERIQLQRDILMPILFIIKFSYQYFFRDEIYKVQKKLCKCVISQRGIRGTFENLYKKDECLDKIQNNFENTVEMLTVYLKRRGLERKKEKEMSQGNKVGEVKKKVNEDEITSYFFNDFFIDFIVYFRKRKEF